MLLLERVLFLAATLLLCVGSVWSVRTLMHPPADGTAHLAAPVAHRCVMGALVGYSGFLLLRAVSLRFLPVTGVFEAVTFFLWCSMLMALLVTRRVQMQALPTFFLPFLALLAVLALVLEGPSGTIRQELRRPLFVVHMLCAFLGYAAFTVGALTAGMYVIQERRLRHKQLRGLSRRLPPLEALEQLNRQILAIGFPLFTVAVGLGIFLAHYVELLGDHWTHDAKVLSAGVTWLAYAVLFAGSRTAWLYGRKVAWGTVAGFACALFTFLGTTLLLGVRHGNY